MGLHQKENFQNQTRRLILGYPFSTRSVNMQQELDQFNVCCNITDMNQRHRVDDVWLTVSTPCLITSQSCTPGCPWNIPSIGDSPREFKAVHFLWFPFPHTTSRQRYCWSSSPATRKRYAKLYYFLDTKALMRMVLVLLLTHFLPLSHKYQCNRHNVMNTHLRLGTDECGKWGR